MERVRRPRLRTSLAEPFAWPPPCTRGALSAPAPGTGRQRRTKLPRFSSRCRPLYHALPGKQELIGPAPFSRGRGSGRNRGSYHGGKRPGEEAKGRRTKLPKSWETSEKFEGVCPAALTGIDVSLGGGSARESN